MIAEKAELNVATEFSDMPGPRKRSEGQFSGQQFLEELLRPRFEVAKKLGCTLLVNLNGAAGYPTSFLEEAFGGLAREFGASVVSSTLEIVCDDEPYLSDEILKYIREATSPK